MNYNGTIIEESLDDKTILREMVTLDTKISPVVEKHQTPWLKQWTLHKVEVDEEKAGEVANKLSRALDKQHEWYADYKNPDYHYIIFRGKIFKIKRDDAEGYKEAKEYGISLGIPEYQVDFSPEID